MPIVLSPITIVKNYFDNYKYDSYDMWVYFSIQSHNTFKPKEIKYSVSISPPYDGYRYVTEIFQIIIGWQGYPLSFIYGDALIPKNLTALNEVEIFNSLNVIMDNEYTKKLIEDIIAKYKNKTN